MSDEGKVMVICEFSKTCPKKPIACAQELACLGCAPHRIGTMCGRVMCAYSGRYFNCIPVSGEEEGK